MKMQIKQKQAQIKPDQIPTNTILYSNHYKNLHMPKILTTAWIDQDRMPHHGREGNMKSKWATQLNEHKILETNEEWIFHHNQKHW